MTQAPPAVPPAAALVIAAGVAAALHVGKLAPALQALQQALGLSLVQAGFLLSLVQGAGMTLGLALGALADGLGGRRSVLIGLATLALASALGGTATGVGALMALRVAEGFGFLLVVLPAPGLVRALVPPARLAAVLGVWGAYMPLATALALLLGPLWIGAFGWRSWWWLLGTVSALMALAVWRAVPVLPRVAASQRRWTAVRATLATPGPWLVAMVFACYSGQWLAVIGFLPTICLQAGLPAVATGLLTAGAAATNIVGNVASGRALQRGVQPLRLLVLGFGAMAATALLAFGLEALPALLRYAAVLVFSGLGGLIPGTLFSLALRVAPGEGSVGATVGWMQQWSSFGQFIGPPAVAAVAAAIGGWHWTGAVTGAFSACGVLLAWRLAARLR